MIKSVLFFLLLSMAGCGVGPGRLKTLKKHGIPYQRQRTTIDLPNTSAKLSVVYTGCGGLYILKDNQGIFVDPFFSNQKLMRIGSSVFRGKKKIASNREMIDIGIKSIETATGKLSEHTSTIFTAHSHYDHLMDVPALFAMLKPKPTVYVNRSGFNTVCHVVDTNKMVILEDHMTTQEVTRPPITLQSQHGTINVYPILGDHNPHFKNISFFSGSKTEPANYFTDPFGKTSANDWLEGNTFSFLIDYVGRDGTIDFRIFIQSSTCNPPAGIPSPALLKDKAVDVAFLGLASFHFSPDYPCTLLQAIDPKEIVWIHWEDLFRKYSKEPKTLRGTDLVKFFDLPCVKPYKAKALLPWPRAGYDFK
ncbi:MAG TPA: hypothetical protein VFG46_09205 [Chryseolinea sp.]|nr:hypothetical protein [Chryseolinea sp.]